MTAQVYTSAEVDQLLTKAVAAIPASAPGLTVEQVQQLIDASIAKALAALPLPVVSKTAPPASTPDGVMWVSP